MTPKWLGHYASACFNSASTIKESTLRSKAYANAALTEFVKLQREQHSSLGMTFDVDDSALGVVALLPSRGGLSLSIDGL